MTFRVTAQYKTINHVTLEDNESADRDQAEYKAMGDIRDMDDAAHDIEIVGVDEV
jgi:hypothetical protein